MSKRTLTVTGCGEVSAAPDAIEVGFTIAARNERYDETVRAASGMYEAVETALVSCGFEKSDIKTSNYSINADYNNEYDDSGRHKRVFAGYRCEQNLTVRFALDMDRLSQVIGAVSSGVAEPELTVAFTVADAENVRQQAVCCACENAQRRAQMLADSMSVELGKIKKIIYGQPHELLVPAAAYLHTNVRAAAQFVPEDVKVSDTVTVIWEIS